MINSKNTVKATSFYCKTITKRLLLLAVICCLMTSSYAQQKATIKYKTGVSVSGELIRIVPLKEVVLKSTYTDSMVIAWKQIASIDMASEMIPYKKAPKPRYPYNFESFYGTLDIRISEGKNTWDGIVLSPGTAISIGKYLYRKRFLGIGVSAAIDGRTGLGSTIAPVGIELRGHFRNKSLTPFYTLTSGYSFVTRTIHNGEGEKIDGSFFINPAIGVISKKRENVATYFKIGYLGTGMHEKFYEVRWQQGVGNVEVLVERDRKLKTFSLSFGLYFD